jgi:hypothetical protein
MTLSEKNNPVIVPWPSAQRATGARVPTSPGGLGLSGSRGSLATDRAGEGASVPGRVAVKVMFVSCSKAWLTVRVMTVLVLI